jgi:hypothetical protein
VPAHQVVVEIERVPQRRCPDFVIGHDRRRVLEEVPDVAIRVIGGDEVVVGVGRIRIELIAETGEREVLH